MAAPARRRRPAHGSLHSVGAKPQLQITEQASWERWRGRNEAARAIRWIEKYARIPTGQGAGNLIKLAAFQRQIVHDLYDNLAAFESMPTGQGKTTLFGAIALERICRGDDYAEADVIATKLGQAEEVIAVAARIAEANPAIRERCALYDEATELRYRPTGSRARAQPARLKAIEGLNFSIALIDEVGFADDGLTESLIARLGKRPDAHLLGMGTPGFDPNMLWRLRRDHHEGTLPSGVVYRECAGPEGCDVDDRQAWSEPTPPCRRVPQPRRARAPGRAAAGAAVPRLPPRPMGRPVRRLATTRRLGGKPARPCPHRRHRDRARRRGHLPTHRQPGRLRPGRHVFHCWSAERATDDELRRISTRSSSAGRSSSSSTTGASGKACSAISPGRGAARGLVAGRRRRRRLRERILAGDRRGARAPRSR